VSRRSAVLLVLCGAMWGTAPLFVAESLKGLGPVDLTAMRNAVAALALGVVLFAGRRRLPAGLLRGLVRRPVTALIAGGVGFTGPLLLVSRAQQDLPAGLVAVIMSSSPLLLALAAPFLVPDDRLGVRGFVGLVVGVTGVTLAAASEGLTTPDRLLPILLVVGAASMMATYPVLVRRFYGGVPPVAVAMHSACGGLVLALLLVPFAPAPGAVGTAPLLAVVALGVACTAAPFAIYAGLVARIGAVRASAANYLIPFTAVLLGLLLLGEDLRVLVLAGLALILGGVYLTSTVARAALVPDPEPAEALR